MTGDNEERTKIRMLAQIIQYIGVFFSTVAPTMLVSFFKSGGFTDYQAWHYTAWLEGCLCVATLIVVFFVFKALGGTLKSLFHGDRRNDFRRDR